MLGFNYGEYSAIYPRHGRRSTTSRTTGPIASNPVTTPVTGAGGRSIVLVGVMGAGKTKIGRLLAQRLEMRFADADGGLHTEGTMRLATAYDEIAPLGDPRVRANPGYLVIILLSRVVTRLGTIEFITPQVFENMYAGDLAHLEDLYQRINLYGSTRVEVECPHCDEEFGLEMARLGG